MYATYERLNLHVSASSREVIKAASRKLKKTYRYTRRYRTERHAFYREMLEHHRNARELVRQFRF